MELKFIREELCEARYMRTHRDTVGRSGDNIAQGFFEHLLVLQQMRFENPTWAKKYAKATLKFQSFTNVRTGATDLHNLAAIIANPSLFGAKVPDLGNFRFDELRFKRYLRNIIAGRYEPSMDRAFFLKMQKNLGIGGSMLKTARRVMADYGATNTGERKAVSTRMMNSFRQDSKFRSDMFKPYTRTVKNKQLLPTEKKGLGLAAKTAIGMATGGAIGWKVGKSEWFN